MRLVRERLQGVCVPGPLDVHRIDEALCRRGRVQHLLVTRLRAMQEVELLQALGIVAEGAHDLLRGQHTPVVGRRIVAELRK